jgi:N4-gp56 family major capsid protein
MAFTPPFTATGYTGTGQLDDQVKKAYDLMAHFALRSNPCYEIIADVKSTSQSHNGSGVQFTFLNDLGQATSELAEHVDVTPQALGDSAVNITLKEYGNAVLTTAKVRATSFLNVDSDAANIVGYNMADSMDKIVADIANGGSKVIYANGAANRGAIVPADKFGAAEARQAVADLRTRSAPGWENGNYMAIIHPNVSYDLRSDTAVTDVINYQLYQGTGEAIKAGSIGTFNGVEYIENPRAGVIAAGGTAVGGVATQVFQTLIVGRQFMAKAFSRAPGFGPDPSVVFGPQVDVLRRYNPIGWYHLAGYGRFREASGIRIESGATINTIAT